MQLSFRKILCWGVVLFNCLALQPVIAQPASQSNLLQPSDLKYLGAFRVPQGKNGEVFEFGGSALAYHEQHDSLFLVGHDQQQAISEIQIPEITTGEINELHTATVLQEPTKIVPKLPHNPLRGDLKIGGLHIDGDRILGTIYVYYDADNKAKVSHFTLSSHDLKTAEVQGLYPVGTDGGGWVGGYLARVPDAWQSKFEAKWLTGQAALAIISRTSSGPCAYLFDPQKLGEAPAPATPLVRYPLETPLAKVNSTNPLFNMCTSIRGLVFPNQSDSLLFFGAHGIGPFCYGTGEECNDSVAAAKGPHAPPYKFQVWAYDANELLDVNNGSNKPWQVKPYKVWNFDLPHSKPAKKIGGVAYDAKQGRIFLSQLNVDQARPLIHVFRVPVASAGKNASAERSRGN